MSRKPRPFALSEADRQQLAHIVERGSDWRVRQRARTLLLLHSGKPINTVATEQAVPYTHLRTHETKGNLECRLRLEKKKTVLHIHIALMTY